MIKQSDQFLIDKIRERDAEAFETLWARYSTAVRRHIMHTVRDESAAEDLVQEAFLRIWTSAEQWDGRGKFKAWFFRIATNLALNHLRTVRRRKQQPLEIPPDDFDDADESAPDPDWMIDTSINSPDVMLEQAEQSNLLWRLVEETAPRKTRGASPLISERLESSRSRRRDRYPGRHGEVAITLFYKTSRPRMEGDCRRNRR